MRPFVLALGLLASMHAQADTIAEVFNKAWLRLPQAQSQASREAELRAGEAAASELLPAPPSLGIGHRTDRFNRNAGAQEYEIDVALPLWLPGEKDARRRVASSESALFAAVQSTLRLQLAGDLREAYWQLRQAETAKALSEGRLATAQHIESDVARRVKAGDLARSDLLLAQAETSAAGDAVAEAELELAIARQSYVRIVGDARLPDAWNEPPASAAELDAHPLLAEKRAQVENARAAAQLVYETRRDNPELSVGARRERTDSGERFNNTLAVAIRLPFGSTSRNASRTAAAQAALTEAEAAFRRQRFDIEQDVRQAAASMDVAKRRAQIAQARHALAQENLQLVRKAFSLGEKSLFEFQRTQAVLNEAALAAAQAEIALNRTYARLNQAMGVLP